MKRTAEAVLLATGFVLGCSLAVLVVSVTAWGWAVDVLDD
jgi:hypothetical protein